MKEFFIKIVSRGTSYLIFAAIVSECEESLQTLPSEKHSSLVFIAVSNERNFLLR
jgi:hypothetical protein